MTPIFSQEDRTSRREIKYLLCGQKELNLAEQHVEFPEGRIGQEQYETTPTLSLTQNCSFSSPEPLSLICSKPRDQKTTGSGEENGNCHVKQLSYLRHFPVKQIVRGLITLP